MKYSGIARTKTPVQRVCRQYERTKVNCMIRSQEAARVEEVVRKPMPDVGQRLDVGVIDNEVGIVPENGPPSAGANGSTDSNPTKTDSRTNRRPASASS